jgi:uncharacterized protein (DUF58 family)
VSAPAASAGRVGWRVGLAGASSAAVGLGLVLLGLLAGRADVVLVGAPLTVAVVWGWSGAAGRAADVGRAAVRHRSEGGALTSARLTSALVIPAQPGGALRVRVSATGYRGFVGLLRADRARDVELAVDTARTGRHEVFRVDYLLQSADNYAQTGLRTIDQAGVLVLPGTLLLRQLPLPFRLQGLTGAHGSRRPGDGGDLHDVNLFAPGDRLRRIDWRVTARRAGQRGGELTELYVRRDFATADATVVLVVDSRDEVGPDVSGWGDWRGLRPDEASSLDVAREAAASLARHYLASGDRVGLEDLGRNRRPVPPAGGNQHLRRLLHRLATLAPEGSPAPHLRAPQIQSGSLAVVFSTFLDDEAARMAQQWRRAGHRVIAVDVLPQLVLTHLTPMASLAYRVVRMERDDRIGELDRSGVEIVRWRKEAFDGAGDLRAVDGSGAGDRGGDGAQLHQAITALARRRVGR